MKKVFLVIVTLIGVSGIAQDQYTKGMQRAFQLWGEGQIVEASNLFERIATAETENWLPAYYAAQVNTVASFGETDKGKLTPTIGKSPRIYRPSKVHFAK